MMKRLWLAALAALILPWAAYGQNSVSAGGLLTASSTDCTTVGSCVTLAIDPNSGSVGIQVAGTFSATVQFEGTVNGATWTAVTGTPVGGGAAVSSTTATGAWRLSTAGMQSVRARVSAYTSGGANAWLQSSEGSSETQGATVATSCSTANCATRIYYSNGDAIASTDVVPVQGSTAAASTWSGNPVVVGATSGTVVANMIVEPGNNGLRVAQAGYTASVAWGSSVTAAGANITDHVVGPTVAAGDRIVVLGYKYICAPTVTVNVTFSMGFGAANVPGQGAGLLAEDVITDSDSTSGVVENFSIPQPGAAGEEVRLTSTTPTGGTCSVGLRYYTEDAP